MIAVSELEKSYKSGETSFYALNKVSFNINDGEFVAIVGKSGSGKSTLLNIIGTLDRATLGTIVIDEQDINSLDGKELAAFRNKKLGFVFQSFYLEPEYTVYENVELPLVIAGSFGKENTQKVQNALEIVGLKDKIKSKAKNLSGGECQRVAIARAIINDPQYIFADEPCGNLDSANSANIIALFRKLNSLGKTVVMVTHDDEDARAAQRIVTLSDGRIISDEKCTLSD